MPEIPEIHLPPAAINNARQALGFFLLRGCCTDPTKICDHCAEFVAEQVALGLVGGGGYRITANGRIHKPVGRTYVEREVIREKRPFTKSVPIRDPYEEIEAKSLAPKCEGT